jgi:hypothetical protein
LTIWPLLSLALRFLEDSDVDESLDVDMVVVQCLQF